MPSIRKRNPALHLDHFGAEVAEHLGRERALHDLAQVQDTDPGERLCLGHERTCFA